MANLDLEKTIPLTIVYISIVIISLTGNIFSLLTHGLRRRLQKPHLRLPVILCLIDISAVCIWTIMSIIYMHIDETNINYSACVFQDMVTTFYIALNFHSLLLLGFERTLKIVKPSKYDELVTPFVTAIVIGSLILFDLLYAFYPLIGWAEVKYYPDQYQCIPEYQVHVSYLNFLFVTIFVFPISSLVVLFIICFSKITNSKKKVVPGNGIILETYIGTNVNSYSHQVLKMNSKFRNAGMKMKKPKLKATEFTTDGVVSNSDTEEESSQTHLKQPNYFLSRTDFQLLKTYVIVLCVYVICWFPYLVLTYTWTYSRNPRIPDWLLLTGVTMTHFTAAFKPYVYYLFNDKIKSAFKRTFYKRKHVIGLSSRNIEKTVQMHLK